MIRSNGTIFYSFFYLFLRAFYRRLKYMFSVISVIVHLLPANTKIMAFVGNQRFSHSCAVSCFHGLVVPLWNKWTVAAGQKPVHCFTKFHQIWRPPCSSPILFNPIWPWEPPIPVPPVARTPTCLNLFHLVVPLVLSQHPYLRFFFGFLIFIPHFAKNFWLKYFLESIIHLSVALSFPWKLTLGCGLHPSPHVRNNLRRSCKWFRVLAHHWCVMLKVDRLV